MFSITASLREDPISKILNSAFVPPTTTTRYNLPSGNYIVSNGITLKKMYPVDDNAVYQFAHHKSAYPGMPWYCPVRAMGGSNPKFYEIVRAPVGVTIGEFLKPDLWGDYTIDPDYGLLKWENPTPGTHSIVVRCTDQMGQYVVFSWIVTCAVGRHIFVAPAARGDGTGSSYSNAASESAVILASSTSPAIGKVIVLCGGTYASSNPLVLSSSTGGASVIGYPGETAIWGNKITYGSDDCTIGFITVKGVSTTDFGVVRSYSASNRLASFYNNFVECFNGDTAVNNNQSVHGYSSAGQWRDNVVQLNNTYIDCNQMFAFDAYNMESMLVQGEVWITSNTPALLTQNQGVWFPKARIRSCEISFCKYDNPHVSGRSAGIIMAYNGIDGNHGSIADSNIAVEYNFVRCSETESAIFSNGAANLSSPLASPVAITNRISRNTIIGGGIASRNYDYSYGLNRRSFLSDNVLQRSGGQNATYLPVGGVDDSLWYSNSSMLFGSAIVDSTGKVLNSAYRGKKGSYVYGENL